MEQIAPFIENISKKVKLSAENLELLLTAFKIIKVSKKQFIIQPGFVAKQRTKDRFGKLRNGSAIIGTSGQ